MKVLVACEFSGTVRDAFIRKGHDAWSCDIIPSLNGGPHIQDDVLNHLQDGWDLMIAHPSCDRLLVAGALHWPKWKKNGEQEDAIIFFLSLAYAPIPKIAIENPVGIMSTEYRKPDQIINPWMFGHTEQKKTCIWLKNLRPLIETDNVYKQMIQLPRKEREKVHFESASIKNGLTRSQRRAITYKGLAKAMASQWG